MTWFAAAIVAAALAWAMRSTGRAPCWQRSADSRSTYSRIRDGTGITRRRRSTFRCRRQFHHRADPRSRAGNGRPAGSVRGAGAPGVKTCDITMNSTESVIYPGIARDAGTFGTVDPADPVKLVVTTSHPAPYTRRVAVLYRSSTCPAQSRRSSSGQMGPTRSCLPRSTI